MFVYSSRHFDRNTWSFSGLSRSVISTGKHGALAECMKWRNLYRRMTTITITDSSTTHTICIFWIASQARNDGNLQRHCEDSERSEEGEAIQKKQKHQIASQARNDGRRKPKR